MYQFIFKLLPWWVFAILALFLTPVTIGVIQSSLEDQAALAAASTAPQPPPVGVTDFDRARDVHAADEVHLLGVWRPDLGEVELDKKGVNSSCVFLASDSRAQRIAALCVPSFQRDSMLTALSTNTDQAGRVAVGGLLKDTGADAVWLEADLRETEQGAVLVAVIEPFMEGRAAALVDEGSTQYIVIAIIAAVNAVVFLVAFFKFRARRARIAVAAPRVPQVPRRPGSTVPIPPKPSKGEFGDGPIVSKKGFFR